MGIAIAPLDSVSPITPLSHSAVPVSQAESNSRIRLIHDSYGRLPLSFEQNRGQVDREVKFLSRGSGYTLFLTPTEAVLALNARAQGTVLRMKPIAANPAPEVSGLEELSGKSNYFIGSDPQNWRTNVATFAKVKYRDVYPGIDLVYYGNQRQLEYDWIVSPPAEPGTIRFAVEGAEKIEVDSNGDLVLAVTGGEVSLHKPVVYQETAGVRYKIESSFVKKNNQEIGFSIAHYDPAKPLVIDPVLSYSTYLGGSTNDRGTAIAVDSSGNAYVTGWTYSTNFPTANPRQPAHGGGLSDVFVTKVNASGSALIYATFLGGGDSEGDGDSYYRTGPSIALDSSGNAYVTGMTNSTNFPTANPRQPAPGGGTDAFVTKFNPSGSALVFSTYHGGLQSDYGNAIAVDSSGNVYLTGTTSSSNFPTASPLQPALAGGTDAFVTKFNPSGSALVFSTYHGGFQSDYGNAIAVDSSGSAYVTGTTSSNNFPTANPLQPSLNGASDAFVTKFNPPGSALIYSTYHGGSLTEFGFGIALDSSGNAYVTGQTGSTNFTTINARQPVNAGGGDAFLTKFNPSGSSLIYSTYHGGWTDDIGRGIAVDSSDNVSVTGSTLSFDLPTANAFQPTFGGYGYYDAFLAKFNPTGNALIYSTFHGGADVDDGYGIALDSSGNAYVTGTTRSVNFPTANPLQLANAGGFDAFITRIEEPPPILKITMSKNTYVNGEPITAAIFLLQNLGSTQVKAELAVWFEFPGMEPISILNFGADGSFSLSPNLHQELGPVIFFTVTSSFPRGGYELNSRMVHPVTKKFLSEDINGFLIQ